MKSPIVILAGGKGTRLGTLTREVPKPMVTIGNKPFLYWLIKHYWNQGFREFIISTGYKAEAIENYSWPWRLEFDRDKYEGSYEEWYFRDGNWVVNGDTWIPDYFPLVKRSDSVILTRVDTDAGAQHIAPGKVKVSPVKKFFDIGTPFGLDLFQEYFKTEYPNGL